VNSFKAYFGHTLGAAGVIESVATVHALYENTMVRSLGFESHGVSGKMNVIERLTSADLQCSLKTGAGFGGCNAAIVFSKNRSK
jgi:3-oxoacyl-[acyl-carrier-protein] synthase-1